MKRTTTKIELVETANLALCLQRLTGAPYDSERRAYRALYHAILIADIGNEDQRKAIREALRLP